MPRVNKTPWIDRHAGTTPVKAPGRKGLNWIAGRLARIHHPDIECETFYSLAQHSVLMARILEHDARLALHGLMYHAPAAWLGGITREAQREIADHMITRIQEFLDGEREFEDAINVQEFVAPVSVLSDRTIIDAHGNCFDLRVE